MPWKNVLPMEEKQVSRVVRGHAAVGQPSQGADFFFESKVAAFQFPTCCEPICSDPFWMTPFVHKRGISAWL